MQTIQLGVDDVVLRKFGEEKIKEYVDKMISRKKMEYFTDLISKSIKLSESDYEKELEEIRRQTWEEYKKDLPL